MALRSDYRRNIEELSTTALEPAAHKDGGCQCHDVFKLYWRLAAQ